MPSLFIYALARERDDIDDDAYAMLRLTSRI